MLHDVCLCTLSSLCVDAFIAFFIKPTVVGQCWFFERFHSFLCSEEGLMESRVGEYCNIIATIQY